MFARAASATLLATFALTLATGCAVESGDASAPAPGSDVARTTHPGEPKAPGAEGAPAIAPVELQKLASSHLAAAGSHPAAKGAGERPLVETVTTLTPRVYAGPENACPAETLVGG